MRGIAIRDELTDEWKKRDVKGEPEYAILTAEIYVRLFKNKVKGAGDERPGAN
jgi:hypothetical protein